MNEQQITQELVDVLNHVFGTMRLAYPNFDKAEDIEPKKRLWAAHLGEFEPARIMKASKVMVDSYPNREPTIGQFKIMVRGQASNVPRLRSETPRQPGTLRSKAMANMEAILDGCAEPHPGLQLKINIADIVERTLRACDGQPIKPHGTANVIFQNAWHKAYEGEQT